MKMNQKKTANRPPKKYAPVLSKYSDPSLYLTVVRFVDGGNSVYQYANDRTLKLFNTTNQTLSTLTRAELYGLLPDLLSWTHVQCAVESCIADMLTQSKKSILSESFTDDRGIVRDIDMTVEPLFSDGLVAEAVVAVKVKETNPGENAFAREDELITHTHQIRALRTIIQMNEMVNTEEDPDIVYLGIMKKIQEVMITEASSLLLYDAEKKALGFTVALGDRGEMLSKKAELPLDRGIGGWVARNRTAAIVNDPYDDPRFDRKYDEETGFVTRAVICTPLVHKGELLGVIQAINPVNRKRFSRFDLELMSLFSSIVSTAIGHLLVHKAIAESEKNSFNLLFNLFSEREKEYLVQYSRGLSRKEIAKEMNIYPETCDAYFRRIQSKLETMPLSFDGFLADLKLFLGAAEENILA